MRRPSGGSEKIGQPLHVYEEPKWVVRGKKNGYEGASVPLACGQHEDMRVFIVGTALVALPPLLPPSCILLSFPPCRIRVR